LIRPGAIGDCILSFPALEHLKTGYTEVWVPSPVVPLVGFADKVRSLSSTGLDMLAIGDLEAPAQLLEELQNFESITSWYGANREDFRRTLAAAGIFPEFHPALPPSCYSEHATDFFARQVHAPLGKTPRIGLPPAQARNAVVIHPFSGSPRKNWPIGNFVDLAQHLPCPVDWIRGPDEQFPGATHIENLGSLASWMLGARLYIGNDSGITHLAAAAGCSTLALFGPTNPEIWAPRGPNVSVLRTDPLSELSVRTVLNAANRLLDLP
jgi:ADP-heptose:LPS heptosyltransferase